MITPRHYSIGPWLKTISIAGLIALGGCGWFKRTPVAEVEVAPAAGTPDLTWGTYLHDEYRTNSTTEAIKVPLKSLWKKRLSPLRIRSLEETSSPVISDGVVFVGSTTGTLYALDLDRGKTLWEFKADFPVEATATVAGGMVCFGSSGGIFRCLNRESGAEIWHFNSRSEILSAPLIADGRLHFSSSDNRLYTLSAETGEKLWSYSRPVPGLVSTRLFNAPTLSREKQKIYNVFSDGYLVCLNAETGKELWKRRILRQTPPSQRARRTPAVRGGLVYVIDDVGGLLMLDEDTGELMGKFGAIKAVDFAVSGKVVYVAGMDSLLALNRTMGKVLWTRELTRGVPSSVVLTATHLFIFSNKESIPFNMPTLANTSGHVEAYTLRKGSPVWYKRLSSTVYTNAAAAANRIVILTSKGTLQVLGTDPSP
ncbi:MAG: PQQ-binding-like beta-propeller repeat protein [Thermodesulfobacteriota bacterium]